MSERLRQASRLIPRHGVVWWAFRFFCVAHGIGVLAVAHGGTPSWHADHLYRALTSAEADLWKGLPRSTVISNLTIAIAAEPGSGLVPFAQSIVQDLRRAVAEHGDRPVPPEALAHHPEKYLSETTASGSDLTQHRVRDACESLVAHHPQDPVVVLVREGRPAVGRLIELLEDRSVARTQPGVRANWGTPPFLRVCEVAMSLIEHLSGCDFLLNQRKPEDYVRVLPHLRDWWERNRNRSYEEGIRDELDAACRIGQDFDRRQGGLIWMARNLAESGVATHAVHGEKMLGEMVRTWHSMEAAGTLVAVGSVLPFQILRERYATPGLPASEIFTREEVLFLSQYGGAEEWRMLHVLTELEIAAFGQVPELGDGVNREGVLPVLVEEAEHLPVWVVPSLAMALSQTNLIDDDEFFASEAVQALEKLTGESFGFDENADVESRLAAARRATRWWERTGKATYSTERLAALWRELTPPEETGNQSSRRRAPPRQVVPAGFYAFRWPLKPSEGKAPAASGPLRPGEPVDLVVRISANRVACVRSSLPEVVGAEGVIDSEGAGRFGFHLRPPGYQELSHQWTVRIDGSFQITDADGTAIATPVR